MTTSQQAFCVSSIGVGLTLTINGYPAWRIRPYHLLTGGGGHGDHILEIACSEVLPNIEPGRVVEIELFE
jgi:hypothetical protein